MSYRLTLTSLLVIFLTCAEAQAGEYDDVEIISQTRTEIVLRYRSGPLTWTADADGTLPHVRNAALNETPGHPPILGRVVYVALPPATESVIADVVATGPATVTVNSALAAPGAPYAIAYPYPRSIVTVDDLLTLRGLRVARLLLHPLAIETADGEYSHRDDITVRLRFNGPRQTQDIRSIGEGRASARDPFASVLNALVVNPAQIAAWRVDESVAPALALTKPAIDTDPLAGAGRWLAIHVTDGGVMRVTAASLQAAGVNLASLDPSALRLFDGPGRMLSTLMSTPAPELTETALRVIGGDDGSFDSGDAIEFYALSLNRSERNDQDEWVDIVNRYTRENVYWMPLDGTFPGAPKRVLPAPALPPAPGSSQVFAARQRVRHEKENQLRVASTGYIESYFTWYWQNEQTSPINLFAAQHAEIGTPAVIEVGAYFTRPRLAVDNTTAEMLPSRPDGEDRTQISRYAIDAFDPSADFVLEFPDSRLGFHLDYYSVEYDRRLTMVSGPIRFALPARDERLTAIVIDGNAPEIWEITDPNAPTILTNLDVTGNAVRFDTDQTDGSRHEYYAFENGHRRAPARLRLVDAPRLHTPATGADYVVIGPRAFASATGDFIAYRAATDGLTVRYVATEDIYDAFALGLFDPIAIRRFLRQTYLAWPGTAPAYALLVGDGVYDFLGNSGRTTINHVPPYVSDDDQSISDENYVYFGDKQVLDSEGDSADNPFPDMLIGRWPVKSADDIRVITRKIKDYESNMDLGPWRSRVMMVADDEFGDRNSNPPSVEEVFHVLDAEELARFYIPRRFDINKIYMTEFPFDNPECSNPSARNCRKSSVNRTIVDGLNDGVAIFEYLGHGNQNLLAHERVFLRTEELPQLTNAGKPAAVLTFSCSIGFFDDPGSEGMSEEWFRMADGGAIAVVSATRLVTAGANAALNLKVIDLLLNQDMPGIAAALYTGKLLRQYFARCTVCPQTPCPCPNDRKYVLFGDPAMKIGVAQNRVRFTSISPDTLSALTQTAVSGEIVDPDGQRLTDFDGTLIVTVRDAPRERVYHVNDTRSLEYELAGGTLYRGAIDVTAGQFDFGFIVPKDIAYGRSGAQVMAHATSENRMASGVSDSLWIGGSAGALTDTAGPQIHLETAAGEPLVDGFHIAVGTELVVTISDPSGINLTGAPGHRLEVGLDDGSQLLADLTDLFAYDPGSFEQGQARFTLASDGLGPRRLAVKAWDNANNSTLLEIEIEITDRQSAREFTVDEFLNYPNPFTDRTTFYFRATRAYQEARIRVFTLAGRLIWEKSNANDGMVDWHGTDMRGDEVGNGVYLAQIEVSGRVDQDGHLVDKTAYRETKVVLSR